MILYPTEILHRERERKRISKSPCKIKVMYYKVVAHEMLWDAEAWKIPSGCENSGGSKTEMVFELFRDLNKEPM